MDWCMEVLEQIDLRLYPILVALMSVYGLLLICKQSDLADMVRLHTYIRPLKLAYIY